MHKKICFSFLPSSAYNTLTIVLNAKHPSFALKALCMHLLQRLHSHPGSGHFFIAVITCLLLGFLAGCQTQPTKPSQPSTVPSTDPAPPPEPKAEPVHVPKPSAPPAKPVPTTQPPAPPSTTTGDNDLKAGLNLYTNGEYKKSEVALQRALSLGLANRADRINAFKHLAFINCASKQTTACRYYFRQALNVNPAFQLSPAEAGHPLWGPVFSEVKQGYNNKK